MVSRALLVSLSAAAVALPGGGSGRPDGAQGTLHDAALLESFSVGVRRELHQIPELLYGLKKTSAYVRAQLDKLHIPYQYPIAGEGIVATIGTGKSPCVGLRADMDALPIHEADDTGCTFRSKHDGKMHACGHDAHTTMLLTAGRMLKERESEIEGTVKLIFQPAEEGGAGGLMMVQEGVMTAEPRIERAFAMHVWPGATSGTLSGTPGVIMAAAGFYHIKMHGHGGHAAMPHTTIDPFTCVAAALSGIQTIVARNVDPLESGVISNTFVNGGSAYNVIPPWVEMGGTIRSLSREGYRFLEERLRAVVEGAAALGQCRLELTMSSLDDDCKDHRVPPGAPGACTFPPTINTKAAYALARGAAAELAGVDNVFDTAPTMAGEDFAYFLEKVPGAMMFLGIGNASLGTNVNLHHPRFQMDESQMKLGAALHVEMALRSLATPVARGCGGATATDEEMQGSAASHAQCAEGTYIEMED